MNQANALRHATYLDYDNGSVIVTGMTNQQAIQSGIELAWDHALKVWRVPAYRYQELTDYLSKEPLIDCVNVPNESFHSCWSNLGWGMQIGEALCSWKENNHVGTCALPTAGLRRKLGIAALKHLSCNSLVLVHNEDAIDDWLRNIRQVFRGSIGVVTPYHCEVAPLTLATYQGMSPWATHLGNQFRLLVVDEAHHLCQSAHDEELQMFAAPFRLGLTSHLPHEPHKIGAIQDLIGPVTFDCQLQRVVRRSGNNTWTKMSQEERIAA